MSQAEREVYEPDEKTAKQAPPHGDFDPEDVDEEDRD
jgi:hypothetical protein